MTDKTYYVVYDQSGKQCGFVSVDDIERERKARPDLRFVRAKLNKTTDKTDD